MSEPVLLARSSAPPSPTTRGRLPWVLGAFLLLVAGTLASVVAASGIANDNVADSGRGFRITASDVATKLQQSIEDEQSLLVGGADFVLGNPTATTVEFTFWMTTAVGERAYPGLRSVGTVAYVRGDQLDDFEARARSGETGPLLPGILSFPVLPPGARDFYCVGAVSAYGGASAPVIPAGLDLCTTTVGPALLEARDSGESSYLASTALGGEPLLLIQRPMYSGGGVPSIIAARRDAFAGWIGVVVAPDELLDAAMSGVDGIHAELQYGSESESLAIAGIGASAGGLETEIDLGGQWRLVATAPSGDSGLLAAGDSTRMLLLGTSASVLLATLLYVLGTSRSRALRMVVAKTDELRHQALHDALTGLPNRLLIVDRIEQLLARGERTGATGAALFIDLDGFKNINDTLGHQAGDQLLQAVARRLTATLRGADTVARMGGDEFVVLVDGSEVDVSPELVAERLVEVIRQPFDLPAATSPLRITASIGVAIGQRPSAGELLRDADLALYQAKAKGRNCYQTFRPEMQADVAQRVELEFDLRSALSSGELTLVYQPIYDLQDLSLVGAEALLRWNHPTLGVIAPEEFVPLLEQSGQIAEVGRWVLLQACRQMAAWRRTSPNLAVAVNVSARQFDTDDIVDHVQEALAASGLDASQLTIEMTETALMRHPEQTARCLGRLKALGVQIAVDDFGTGYSSLAYLEQFPVDCLKIDRSFTSSINRSAESTALINTLIQLGRDLGLTTLAEGVETIEQVDELRRRHVDEAQGFLLSEPLAPEAFATTILPAHTINH